MLCVCLSYLMCVYVLCLSRMTVSCVCARVVAGCTPGSSPGQQGAPVSSQCLVFPDALPPWSLLAVPLAQRRFKSFLVLLGRCSNYCHRCKDLA